MVKKVQPIPEHEIFFFVKKLFAHTLDAQFFEVGMLRYFLCLFIAVSFFAFACEEDDLAAIHEDDGVVSYMGMTIYCPWGSCTDYYSNPKLERATKILADLVRKVFYYPYQSPLALDISPDSWSFKIWSLESETEFSVYDWQTTGGFYDLVGDYPDWKEPRKIYSLKNYSRFQDVAAALRRDVRFYYRDVIQQEIDLYRATLPILKKKERDYWSVRWDLGETHFLDFGCGTPIYKFIENLKETIPKLKKKLRSNDYEEKSEKVEQTIAKLDEMYRDIFSWCLAHHQEEGIVFNGALEDFLRGEFELAIDQIRFLIERAEELGEEDELLAKLYLLKGQIQSEFGLYAEAVIGLTTAIQKNPALKEAYFERAACYFELGDFNRAIEDFLASGMRSRPIESVSQLGLGVSAGIVLGSSESALEFIPNLVGTARGLGNGLWALVEHPVQTSQQFLDAVISCIEYIKSHSTLSILQTMVPELKELIQNYDRLTDFEAGKLIGRVIGKYGMDILLGKEGLSLIKAARNLKTADRMMTLEALASPGKTQEILAVAEKHRVLREAAIRKGALKIHEGRQGKHIKGHPNYEDILKQKRRPPPSIFEHTDPERLLRDFAGTGIKDRGNMPFTAGYVEIVDFKEFIGYAVIPGAEKIATTMGKIHYAQDGVHIVPYVPKIGG